MSGSVADRKRLVRITAENLRDDTIDLASHLDFLEPAEGSGAIEIDPRGGSGSIRVDVGGAGGSAEGGLVIRGVEIRAFLDRHAIGVGDLLSLRKTKAGRFGLAPFETKRRRSDEPRVPESSISRRTGGPTVLELFAGCGGMALGFQAAGFRTELAVEWDPAACETLRANVTDRVAACSIQEVERFPEVDVVAGGPPCQGFSNLGEKMPHDPRNALWRHFLRALEQARPRAFVMENVPPLLESAEFAAFAVEARALGFELEARVLNAADHGVAQTRKRAIIIGFRDRSPQFPAASRVAPAARGSDDARPAWRTVREAIADLPATPDGRNWHIGRNPTAMSLERYRHVPPGGNRWNLPPELTPECWKRKTKGGTDLFGRLWWDRPSVTIRTEFYKPEKGRYLHPEADRPITHREAARLQGFPDSFDFRGSRIQVGVQIGNACPPPLAEALARAIREQLP
ncbi:MAG: DNA cytosine methyltransferase [Isosphaeraceae bacterium]|nr:DNA cytosine methyltransferase [Isosphaeraceae bacterium]